MTIRQCMTVAGHTYVWIEDGEQTLASCRYFESDEGFQAYALESYQSNSTANARLMKHVIDVARSFGYDRVRFTVTDVGSAMTKWLNKGFANVEYAVCSVYTGRHEQHLCSARAISGQQQDAKPSECGPKRQ